MMRREAKERKRNKNHKGLLFFMPLLAGLYGLAISFVGGLIIMGGFSVTSELISFAFEIAAIVFSIFLVLKIMPRKFPWMRNYSFERPNWYVIAAIVLLMPLFFALENAIVYLLSFKWAAFEYDTITYTAEELTEDLVKSVSAVFLAPIYEEISFRFMPLTVYKKKVARIVVCVIMSALFAWLHAGNWMEVFIDAMVYSALFLLTKNIWVSICAHACNNLYVTVLAILSYLGLEGRMARGTTMVVIPPTAALIGSAVMAAAGVAVIIYGRKKHKEEKERTSKLMNDRAVREFIRSNARPVELAEYNYFFEKGSKKDIVNALLEFQNPDGGFGHALEADNWNPNSTPIATNDAILKLNRADALDKDAQIVIDAARYLKSGDGFDPVKKKWYFALASNRDYPHAIWWVPEEGSDGITDFNPTVSLATFLVCYSEDDGYYADIVKDAFDFLLKAEKMGSDDIKCYQHAYYMLVKTDHTDLVDLAAAKEAIVRLIDGAICRDISKYGREYAATPSDFFVGEAWDAFYNSSFDGLIDGELNNLVNIQLEDGGFDIYWQWYTDYPEFEEARNMWRPRVSLERLLFWRGAAARSGSRG